VTVDIGAGDGRFALRRAARDPDQLVVAIDANAAALGAGFSRAARLRLANVLFAVAAAEDLPTELHGLADEIRIQFPWGSLLRLVLDADPRLLDRLAAILRPGGRLVIALSIVPRDGVAGVAELDEPAVTALLGRLQSCGRFAGGQVVPLTPRSARELHSTWANRLRVGHQRPGWLIETVRQGAGVASRWRRHSGVG
jgi:16S rRNA (adenine(1408)-N(1))-methyltransferase